MRHNFKYEAFLSINLIKNWLDNNCLQFNFTNYNDFFLIIIIFHKFMIR